MQLKKHTVIYYNINTLCLSQTLLFSSRKIKVVFRLKPAPGLQTFFNDNPLADYHTTKNVVS